MIYDRKLHASKPALPEGYEKAFTIDLQSDKKTYLIVNLSALAVAAALFLIGCLVTPFRALYADGSISVLLLRAGVLIVGSVAYIILHELVHGITMRYYGSKTVKYGFTGSYHVDGATISVRAGIVTGKTEDEEPAITGFTGTYHVDGATVTVQDGIITAVTADPQPEPEPETPGGEEGDNS